MGEDFPIMYQTGGKNTVMLFTSTKKLCLLTLGFYSRHVDILTISDNTFIDYKEVCV